MLRTMKEMHYPKVNFYVNLKEYSLLSPFIHTDKVSDRQINEIFCTLFQDSRFIVLFKYHKENKYPTIKKAI